MRKVRKVRKVRKRNMRKARKVRKMRRTKKVKRRNQLRKKRHLSQNRRQRRSQPQLQPQAQPLTDAWRGLRSVFKVVFQSDQKGGTRGRPGGRRESQRGLDHRSNDRNGGPQAQELRHHPGCHFDSRTISPLYVSDSSYHSIAMCIPSSPAWWIGSSRISGLAWIDT